MKSIDTINSLLGLIPAVVKMRGIELYSRGLFQLVYQDEFQYNFQVKGSYQAFYETEIIVYDLDGEVEIGCSCVYFQENDICKHLVPCLLYVSDELQKINQGDSLRISKVVHKKASSGNANKEKADPALKQPVSLTFSEAELLQPGQKLRPFINDLETRKLAGSEIKFFPDKLSLQLTDKSVWYRQSAPVAASVSFKNGQYLFSCQEKSHRGVCAHIHWLAAFFTLYADQRLLELISRANQQELLKRLLLEHGLTPKGDEKIEELLEITFEAGRIQFRKKGFIKDLVNPQTMLSLLQEQLLSKTATAAQKLSLVIPESPEVAFERLPAFVLSLDKEEGQIEKLLAISGKPTKAQDKLASHLELVHSPYPEGLLLNASFAPAYFLKEKINQVLKLNKSDASLFEALREFFSLLKEFPVYTKFEDTRLGYQQPGAPPKKSDLHQVEEIYGAIRLKFRYGREKEFYTLKPVLHYGAGEQTIDLEQDQAILYNSLILVWGNNKMGLINSRKEGLALQSFLAMPVSKVSAAQHPEFLNTIVQPLAQEYPVQFDESQIPLHAVQLQLIQERLYISELNQYVIFRPVVLYEGDREVNVLEDATFFEGQEEITLFERDRDREEAFIALLSSLHSDFKPSTQQGFFYLTFAQMQQDFWFLKAFETLKKQQVHIFGFDQLKNFRFSPHQPTINLKFKSGQDWFETAVEIAYGNNKVKLKDLKKAVREGSGYIELSDGTYGILPEEWLHKFEKLFRSAQLDKEMARIPKTHFNLLDELVDERYNQEVFKEIAKKKERLASFTSIKEAAVPDMLQASLRSYQQTGLNWLNFLREYGWGGILADDMGLGKTLQALALICLEISRNPKQTNLVVAPTTLLFNWKKEIEKFAPGIDYVVHHGERYDSEKALSKHQLVLTSYGIVINDLEMLKKINFNLLIADESQAIKNIHAQRHKALIQLKAKLRLGMSGTPIENNIFELYAQMNFANPGFFQNLNAFKEDYAKAIEQERNPDIVEELRKKIKPFILRRTKVQVLTELPDKTEEYLYCEMGAAQRKVYDAYRNEYRDYLLHKFEEEGVEKSQLYVLEGLTKLRQVCDSPHLVASDFPADKNSAKMEELLNHVMEKTGRHKILVFSQFVGMLQLIEKQFQKFDISYEYLDGKTSVKERERRVEHFQNDPNCRVFLISLKAGGTGLNLTAADYVYLVDPWWNPAVENQAIDRCYRMGQEKKVFAYRMICKDTVEEKIVSLQEQKKMLSDELVGAGDGVMKNLSKDDILALFS